MPLNGGERQVQLLEIHELSLKAAVSTVVPGGDILSRFNCLIKDFAALQKQYGQFKADFAALEQDVVDTKAELEQIDPLRAAINNVKDECENLLTGQRKATERTDILEERIGAVEGETAAINKMLEQFAENHPFAAVVFEHPEDCFWDKQEREAGGNELMKEHSGRMNKEEGRGSQGSRSRSRTTVSEEEGWIVDLPEGDHSLSDMAHRGVSDRPRFGAIRVSMGFEAVLFEFPGFGGKTMYLTAGEYDLKAAGDSHFPRVGAIRLQRLRNSEMAIREDLDKLQRIVEAHTLRFDSVRRECLDMTTATASKSQARIDDALLALEKRAMKLESQSQIHNADIDVLRRTKVDKGEDRGLPEQLASLRESVHNLQVHVDDESKKLLNKADKSMIADKVSREEVQEFVEVRIINITIPHIDGHFHRHSLFHCRKLYDYVFAVHYVIELPDESYAIMWLT